MALTTVSVEAPPNLYIDISTPRAPSCRTMLVCGRNPSRTCATSRRYSVDEFVVFTGRSFSSAMVCGVAVHLHVVLGRPDLCGACRQNQILRRHRIDNIGGRQPIGLQFGGIEVDLNLARLAAIRIRSGRTLHRGQLRAQKIAARDRTTAVPEASCCSSPSCTIGVVDAVVGNDQRRSRSRRQVRAAPSGTSPSLASSPSKG